MKYKLLMIISLFVYELYGQTAGGASNINGLPKNIPSPNAASLGEYGQIPVDLFTGLPNISIPILAEVGDNANMSLSYRASGIRPDQHSGWVGVGWNLNCGGSITRIVNGSPDEMEHPDYSLSKYYQGPFTLDDPNWDTSTFLYGYLSANVYTFNNQTRALMQDGLSKKYPYPDEFVFNFNGISGSFYLNHKGKWIVKSDQNINIKILETISSFNLTETAPQPYNGTYETYTIPIEQIFYGFEITLQDGTVYVFGKTPESVEFNSTNFLDDEYYTNYVASTWYLTKIIKPNNKEITFEYQRDNRAVFRQSVETSIYYSRLNGEVKQAYIPKIFNVNRSYLTYLSRVEFDSGEILFNRSLSNELQYEFWVPNFSFSNNSPGISPWINIQDGWDTTIKWDHNSAYHHPVNFYRDEYEPTGSNLRVKPKSLHWYKLDNIHLKDNHGNTIKEIDFHYTENPSSRLFLDSIVEVGKYQTYLNRKKHSFQYNQLNLPDYNEQNLDHWGYYNNPDSFFQAYATNVNARTTIAGVPLYTNYRAPSPYYTEAGVLKEIIYPTGGKTSFEYEGNAYGKVVEKVSGVPNNTLSVAVESGAAGGLRIKKITSDALNPSSPPIVKNYFYVTDYKNSNMISSGILSGRPNYLEESSNPSTATDYYWYWNSYSVEPMAFTKGSQITYSKVVEKTSTDNGFVEYAYTNHDDPTCMDEIAKMYHTSNSEQWKYCPITDRSFERGKLIYEKYYNSAKDPVKSIDYTYEKITNSEDNSVRALYNTIRQYGRPYSEIIFKEAPVLLSTADGVNACVFEIPTDFKYLSKKEETDYLQGNLLTTVTEFEYNSERQLKKQSFKNSNGDVLATHYSYPSDSDMANNYPQNYLNSMPLTKMNLENMVSYPLMVNQSFNGITNFSKLYTYTENQTNDNINLLGTYDLKISLTDNIPPNNLSTKSLAEYTDTFVYEEYDDYGNLIQARRANGIDNVYIWGYNQSKIIAIIENATLSQVGNVLLSNSLSIEDLQELSDLDDDRYNGESNNDEFNLSVALNNLRSLLPDCLITTYTYDPLVGITSITDAKNYTTYYQYDQLNRLSYILDNEFNILKKYVYNYKNQ